MQECDVCVIGGGIIGSSIALELQGRGARVIVLERGKVLSEASQAAAGMLAAADPDNPPELLHFAQLSNAGYHQYLGRVEDLSAMAVQYQTNVTYQGAEEGQTTADLPSGMVSGELHFRRLNEQSIDPRQLATALRAALEATSIRLLEDTSMGTVNETPGGLTIQTSHGEIQAEKLVYALGAWSVPPVTPRKGQMLAVQMPVGGEIDYVVRTPEIYMVPRLFGPRAGQMVIGATVEDAGFVKTTDAASLGKLRALAAKFLPMLADQARFPTVDQWAGLRPDTPDHLPLIGWAGESRRQFVAAGHYRNGILLAPATAHVVARLLAGDDPGIDLAAFSPNRFA